MIALYDIGIKQDLPIKIVLQIHDELILEVPDEFVPKALHSVKLIMEDIMPFSVPLKVNVSANKCWFK